MKIFCFIMALFFLVAVGISIANIFIEWNGCKTCETMCAAEASSRYKSILLTLVLSICEGLWIYLFVDNIITERHIKQEHDRQDQIYKTNMQNSIERKEVG